MSNKLNIHFISRAYPPVIGGIENQNKAVYEHLSKHETINTSINTFGKKALPFFLPWVVFKSIFLKKNTTSLLGDGVLAIIPWFVKKFKRNNRYICIVHGLDISYPSQIYQIFWIKKFFFNIDHFIAVSHNTKDILIAKGINARKITVIPNGFNFSVSFKPNLRKINLLLNEDTENKVLLITLGRLVKRKGVTWFIENVMPHLPSSILYIIAGDGPEKKEIDNIIKRKNLSQKIKLLGKVSESEKQLLLSSCNLFVQPNIEVKHDIEGFGITVIEASAYGLPVIASDLEGLKDAIHNNKNGWLVTSGNKNDFINKIQSIIKSPRELHESGISFKNYSQNKFDWNTIIYKYLQVINNNR